MAEIGMGGEQIKAAVRVMDFAELPSGRTERESARESRHPPAQASLLQVALTVHNVVHRTCWRQPRSACACRAYWAAIIRLFYLALPFDLI